MHCAPLELLLDELLLDEELLEELLELDEVLELEELLELDDVLELEELLLDELVPGLPAPPQAAKSAIHDIEAELKIQ